MLPHPTIERLNELRLHGMAAALAEQQSQESIGQLGFEERLGLLVEREATERHARLSTARLRRAELRYPDAVAEDINYRHPRGLDRTLLARLLTGEWIREQQNVILVAPTGLGKSWLACALANLACRQGYTACYLRMPRFSERMALAHGEGHYVKLLAQWAKTDVLVLDDLAMTPLTDSARRDLLEILDDRHGKRSTIVTSQIPVKDWHAALADPTLADAILDRLVHHAHRVNMEGESMRKTKNGLTPEPDSE